MDFATDEFDSPENSCDGDFRYNMERMSLLNRFAFVYTTKLEDMSVLQEDISKYSTKKITQMLLVESKPVYSPENINYMEPVLDSGSESYAKVTNFVEQMNSKASLENSALRLCKPCCVLLIDYRLFPGKSIPSILNEKKRFNSAKRTYDLASQVENVILVNKGKSQLDTSLLVLIDNTNQAYIHRVNHTSQMVTDSFVMENYSSSQLQIMFPRELKFVRYYCCWFGKENIINELTPMSPWNLFNFFLRTEHSCIDGDCQCCCRDSEKNSSKKSRKGKEIKEATKYPENILLHIQKKNDNDPPISNLQELYAIGKGGELVRHYKQVNTLKVDNLKNEYMSLGMKTINKEYCCWYNRDSIINSLFAPRTLKFMKIPHTCKTHNCKCCCKPKNTSLLLRVRDIRSTNNPWPEVLQNTTVYNKHSNKLNNLKTDLKKNIKKSDDNLNILDKVKGHNLVVNTEGKLEVVLDTPAKNVSIAELKMLYHILSISSKQIQQLQISPQEFCQRVNSMHRAPVPHVHNTTKKFKVPENEYNVSSTIPNVTDHLSEQTTETSDNFTSEEINTVYVHNKDDVYLQFSLLMGTKSASLASKFKKDFRYSFSEAYSLTRGGCPYVPNFKTYNPTPDIKKLNKIGLGKKKNDVINEHNNTFMPKINSVEPLSLKRKQSLDRQTLKRKKERTNKMNYKTKCTKSPSKLINFEVDKSLPEGVGMSPTNLIIVPTTETTWKPASIIESPPLITITESNLNFTGTNSYLIGDTIVTNQNLLPVINSEHAELTTTHPENNTILPSGQILDTYQYPKSLPKNYIDDGPQPLLPVSSRISGLPLLSNDSNYFHTGNGSTLHEMLLGPVTMEIPPLVPIARPAWYHNNNTPANPEISTYPYDLKEETIKVTQFIPETDSKMNIEVSIHRDDLLEWPYSP